MVPDVLSIKPNAHFFVCQTEKQQENAFISVKYSIPPLTHEVPC